MTARPHPFDYAFGSVADEWFGEIRAASPDADLPAFSRLEPVERILARMEGDSGEQTEATEEYLRLLYAAYRFWRDGRQTTSVSTDQLRHAMTATSTAGDPAVSSAVYCQLPPQRVWVQAVEGEAHEPLDGFFVAPAGRAGAEVLLVGILGFREERGGFTQVSVTAALPDLQSATVDRDPLLAPTMPGGAVAGFLSVTTVAEFLVLVRIALNAVRQAA